jgi:hypothetical protein
MQMPNHVDAIGRTPHSADAVLASNSSSNAAKTPCAVTDKTPGTEIASIHAGCAVVPGVPDFFNFPPDLPSIGAVPPVT